MNYLVASNKGAIARALVTKPSLILADEPTGNLDSKSSSQVVYLLKRLIKRLGNTILMITRGTVKEEIFGQKTIQKKKMICTNGLIDSGNNLLASDVTPKFLIQTRSLIVEKNEYDPNKFNGIIQETGITGCQQSTQP